jgi:type 1 glutamine amidotransferase
MKRLIAFALVTAAAALPAYAAKKSVVLIAGKPSHGPGQHEHNAGVLLFKKCLEQSAADEVEVKHHLNGEWPAQAEMDAADTILIYSDGGGGHPALQGDRLAELEKQMKRGCGFVCVHYAVEPTIPKGNKEFIDWLGGSFEVDWSVNPHWDASFTELPKHPISNGVKPFMTNDEWYFHMRFRGGMKGVSPILSAVAPDSTMSRPDGHHSGNPAVREAVKSKAPQHVAWAVDREDGGRGFGFTGGHFHAGWANEDQRKLLLNAILWSAKVEVPATGVLTTLTADDLTANQDPKQARPNKAKAAEPAKKAA